MYVTLPTVQSVRTCLQTGLAICILEQALYPIKHVTWYVYALFVDDKEHIKRDCKYSITKVSDNRVISLGGYLWVISSIKQEQLQVRCLEETHIIEIYPPLQIVYLGNDCEGYSRSMFLPAKNEMTTHPQVESCKEYFLQFNYVYTPDRDIGLWWQFRAKMISEKEAKAFITQVAPLGTMDYSLLCKKPPIIKTNYGFALPKTKTQHGEYGFWHIVRNEVKIREQFRKGLQILLDTFHDTMLLYSQSIQVVNFSNISKGFVNIIIMYEICGGKVSEIRSTRCNR